MKALTNFIMQYLLEAANNIAISTLAVAAYLIIAFGAERAQNIIDRSSSAIGAVMVIALLWTLLRSLTGEVARALKQLKEKMNRNQVQL